MTTAGDPVPLRLSDRRVRRIGLRSVALRGWIASVNGERLFLKGANHGPTRMALAEATPDEVRADVDLAVDTGLDLLRVQAHIARPELYEAADEAGLLLWQDMPLQWGYARSVRKQAVRQAREAVDLLGHHPSVAIWCGHNEPIALDVDPGAQDPVASPSRFVAAQQLPSWNRTVLDRSVKRSLQRHDGTRPVIAHSGVLPHPPLLDGTDSHLFFGWYHGDERRPARSSPAWCPAWCASSASWAPRPSPRPTTSWASAPLARPRLGGPGPHPRPPAPGVRPLRPARRPRHLRGAGRRPPSATRRW